MSSLQSGKKPFLSHVLVFILQFQYIYIIYSGLQKISFSNTHSAPTHFSLDGPRPTAMNLTDFRDNALLKLQVGGPFTGGMIDLTNQEYILIQVEQTEQGGQRRRRTQQVTPSM